MSDLEDNSPSKSAVKLNLQKASKFIVTVTTVITEILVIGIIGSYIGSYLSAKTIVADCATVSLAKVGDTYINCTVVHPKKDAETAPPR